MKNYDSESFNTFVLKDYLIKILEKWYIIVTIILLTIFSALIYSNFFLVSKYTSVAKLYVISKSGSSNEMNSNDLSVSTYLAKDYVELIVDRTVLTEVIDDLGLNISYASLKNSILVENPVSTRILEIHVTTPNAETSKKIAESICNISKTKIVDLMGVDKVNIISPAYTPSSAANPVTIGFYIQYAIVGLIFSLLIILFLHVTDDKIKNEQDIEKYLNLSVLGKIPYSKKQKAISAVHSNIRK